MGDSSRYVFCSPTDGVKQYLPFQLPYIKKSEPPRPTDFYPRVLMSIFCISTQMSEVLILRNSPIGTMQALIVLGLDVLSKLQEPTGSRDYIYYQRIRGMQGYHTPRRGISTMSFAFRFLGEVK